MESLCSLNRTINTSISHLTTKPGTTALLNADKTNSSTCPAPPLLPLPPSRPLFPSPLKFLWFSRDNNIPSTSCPPPKPLINTSDPPLTPPQIDEIAPQDAYGKPCTCPIDSDTCLSNVEQVKDEITGKVHAMNGHFSMGSTFLDVDKGWISRFLRLRFLGKASVPELNPRESVESALINAAKEAHQEYADTIHGISDHLREQVVHAELDCSTCMVEAKHERVVHSRESVATFLHEVPITEVQAISKLCVLSNLAYIIPEVQSKQLLDEHQLSFVTSSLVKKEAAEAQAVLERSLAQENKQKSKRGSKTSQEENAVSNALSLNELLYTKEGPLNFEPVAGAPLEEEVKAPKNGSNLEETINKAATQATVLNVQGNCPSEWFICDDAASSIRYLVIQGSESLASWQTNLSFDPTKFEGLGVLVHRGIYEAAQGLYNLVVKEIEEHVRAGSHAKVCFTGHSLGGSLATLLALMLVKRGVVKASAVEAVVTLGAPCVLCAGEGLLSHLGLQQGQFANVVMHRDIVPRAFACDYPPHVGRLLKRVNGTFRDHPCLNYQGLLYTPIGQVMVLQPDNAQSPWHPLLPNMVGLFLIKHPKHKEELQEAAAMEVRQVERAFFNMPHPLEMLRDPGAYGFEGAISRDHDPRSYKKAITTVITQVLRRIRQQTPLLLSHSFSHILLPRLPSLHTPSPIILPHHVTPSLSRKNTLNRYASHHISVGLLVILSMTMDLFSSFFIWA